jgi:hypothetical protein
MDMSPLRRLALPLGLSLALHALLLGAVWLLPLPSLGTGSTTGAPSSPWLVSLAGPRQRARPAAPPGLGFEDDVFPTIHPPNPANGISVNVSPVEGGGEGHDGPPGVSAKPAEKSAPSLLAVPGAARRVVYVLDRSVSMGTSGALKRAVREVIASLRQLPVEAHFQVIAYNRVAEPLLSGDWIRAEKSALADAVRRLNDLTPSGATDHVRALNRALLARPDLIFLVTDADDLLDEQVKQITRRNPSKATIHVVELAAGKGVGGPLARLAESNRGTYRRVSP